METIAQPSFNGAPRPSATVNRALGAFNPALPEDGALIIAGVLRDQLNSLFALIQNIPAGPQGPEGPQGPPFAQAVVDGVTTLAPGTPAWVTVSYYNSEVHFLFGIPTGDPGTQGPPGEVTTAQLNAAIATTANNPTSIEPLNLTISDPPTQSEVQQMLARMNELIGALKRG